MDTSDDPITAIFIGGAIAGGVALAGGFSGGGGDVGGLPSVQAQQATRTAAPLEQLSEQAKKTRLRRASLLTKDWSKPKLGYGGLLGI